MAPQQDESDLKRGTGGGTARQAVRHPHRGLAVFALWVSGLCAPAARGDIFVSNGAGNPYDFGQAVSYSQYTGASKLDITAGLLLAEGLALGPDGNLYVADGQSVLRFNPSTGALIGTFVSPVSGPAFFFGITFGPDGNLYVADNNGYILRFDGTTGAPTGTFSCAPPEGGPCYPVALTFGPDGNLYVSDSGSRGVLKFNGSTLAFISMFVPTMGTAAAPVYPWGLHFGPNGNLYVVFSLPVSNTDDYVNQIFEFNGSSGAQISFSTSGTTAIDFAFGQDTEIYVASSSGFTRYSSSTGSVVGTFGSIISPVPYGFIAIGGPVGISPYLPPYLLYDPVGLAPTQTLRLTVIDGPVRVPPGVPVQAQLGFQNSAGALVGPSTTVNLNPGQTAFLDLDASTLISSGRIELQPVVTALPGTPLGSLSGSVEIYNTSSGVGSVFYPGIPVPPASPITGPPSFLPQGVMHGQSIQISALAPPDSPCAALLSFEDVNGNPVGPRQQVNLTPGTMASLSFNANSFTKSGREEFVPQLAPNNPTGGPGAAPACLGSVEVYNTHTGDTATYQTLLPAIGTPPAVSP